MPRPRIGVVGSNMVDLIAYASRMSVIGETLEAPSFEMGFGGKGANQAVAAAKLGASVVMVSKVGDDMFAEGTVNNLASFGIDTTHVHRVEGRSSGVAPIVVDASGANAILIIKGANADLSPADVDEAAEALKSCDLILLQLEVPLETVYAAIAFGKRHGVKTLLNPAPATTALDLKRIIDVDVFVPNETELAILAGMPVDSEADIVAAARSLLDRGLKTIVVTMGARGALLATPSFVERNRAGPDRAGRHHRRGRRLCRRLRALRRDRKVEDALRMASRYAANSVTRRGTQKAYASLDAFEAFCAARFGRRRVIVQRTVPNDRPRTRYLCRAKARRTTGSAPRVARAAMSPHRTL